MSDLLVSSAFVSCGELIPGCRYGRVDLDRLINTKILHRVQSNFAEQMREA